MLIKAQELAKGEQAHLLHKLITEKNTDQESKITAITHIYNELNIKKLVKDKMNYYYQLALDAFNKVNVESNKKTMLIELADKLMVRES
jgi:geranylgeranyl diphosphate synthase type II